MNRPIFILIYTIFFITSYFSHAQKSKNERLVFPPPPDSTRIVYVTKISSSFDIERKQSALSKFLLGPEPAKAFAKPWGINVIKNKIYVGDSGLGGIVIIDLSLGTFRYFMPAGKGKISKSINTYVDDKGHLYISDVVRGQVLVFDEDENYIGEIGEKEKNKAVDMCVYDNKIWITDGKTNEIEIYEDTPPFKHIRSFPGLVDEGRLYSGTSLKIVNDTVYVSDMGDWSVKMYLPDGTFIRKVGSVGMNIGQFTRPKGIAIDREGIIHAVDAALNVVQMFDSKGRVLMYYGGQYIQPGHLWLPAGIAIDYENIDYFSKYIDESYKVKYLIYVVNQYGPDDITIYAAVEPAPAKKKKKEETEETQEGPDSKEKKKKRRKRSKEGVVKF